MAISTGLKSIEQSAGFTKEVYRSSSSLSGNKLLYTYAKRNETATPYGNLFRSFNFPITSDEISSFNTTYNGTALANLNVSEIIVIEIPKGEYGELIDGKTFKLRLPVVLNSIATSTTVYGSYFGYLGSNASQFLGNNLNKQLSEKRNNYFGFEATEANDYNTNVTFLYSNDVTDGKPKNKGDIVTIYTATTFTIQNDASNKITLSTVTLSTNDEYLLIVESTLGTDDIVVELDGNPLTKNSNPNATTLQQVNVPGLNDVNPKIYQIGTNPISKSIKVTIKQRINTTLLWDVWSSTNKFPSVEGDESKKLYAIYDTVNIGGAITQSPDKPVGILFQDKGFAVITNPELVTGFRYSAGTSSGFNSIPSGSPYNNSDTNFAKIYFTSSTLSNAQFDSITTEFVQNIVCVAGLNEFGSTTNTSYVDAYDSSLPENQKPTFITSIGLYNANQELIGIAKLSEPVKKLPSTVVPFNIRLVV